MWKAHKRKRKVKNKMQDLKQLLIAENEDKTRLDVYLTNTLLDWTRSQIKKQIDDDRVSVNGKKVKAGFKVKKGDVIELDLISIPDLNNVEPENIPLNIVYEDDYLAVVNKPQGMVVHPAVGNYNHTLVNALLYHFNSISSVGEKFRPGIVHRIDKDTSGLLVVAKNNMAHESLAKQIAEHSCFRHYVALCEGEFKQQEGDIILKIERDKKDYKKMAVCEDGKFAQTHFKVQKIYKNYTLVNFQLKTGRTHQIRVHSKAIGHPIVGDKVYGFAKQKFNLKGQLLHAQGLELTHPKTGQRMAFKCEIPDYFANVLKSLTLNGSQNDGQE